MGWALNRPATGAGGQAGKGCWSWVSKSPMALTKFAEGTVAPVRQAHIEYGAHGRLGLGAPDWSAHADVLAIRLAKQPAQQHGRGCRKRV